MSERVEQGIGERGSLLWIQRAVGERWQTLEAPILRHLRIDGGIEWHSPLPDDGYAEYRDAGFLRAIGLDRLSTELGAFWPARGPQWDALGTTTTGQVLLVEAKAHIAEFCTPPSKASAASLARIRQSLERVATALGSPVGDTWHRLFYQYANRLAHLWFLRQHGIDAHLVLVGFLDDREMDGPSSAEAWAAAYRLADYALGLRSRHPLHAHLIHVFPRVPS